MRCCIDAGDLGAEAQVYVVLGVPRLRVDVDRVPVSLADQVVLGQRRSLVWPLGLVADQHDRPAKPLLAQGLGGLGTGQARPHDHVRVRVHALSSFRSGCPFGPLSWAASWSPSSCQAPSKAATPWSSRPWVTSS